MKKLLMLSAVVLSVAACHTDPEKINSDYYSHIKQGDTITHKADGKKGVVISCNSLGCNVYFSDETKVSWFHYEIVEISQTINKEKLEKLKIQRKHIENQINTLKD